MPDNAKRVGPTLLTASAATVYTAPGSTVFHMRSIHFSNNTGTDRVVTMSIGTDAVGTRIFGSMPVRANSSVDWSGYMPLQPAEVLQAYADATNSVTITVSGVESI